jgi:hypothetical protein
LKKGDITEMKAYHNPPAAVMTVMSAVMILLGKEASWATAKRVMSEPGFLRDLA